MKTITTAMWVKMMRVLGLGLVLVAMAAAPAMAEFPGYDCCVDSQSVGCSDAGCQDTVCGVDPFCCEEAWDSICADEANELCSLCQVGSDCCETNSGAGCSDGGVTDCVCEIEPFCCDTYWADYCVLLATDYCDAGCQIGCAGDIDCPGEGETCVDGECLTIGCVEGASGPVCGDNTIDAGGPSSSACWNIGDEEACNAAYHHTSFGEVAPCHWTGDYCIGCGYANASECDDSCLGDDACPGFDNDAGGPWAAACWQVDDPMECANSFHHTSEGTLAPCRWTGSYCQGCGPSNAGLCGVDCEGDSELCAGHTENAGGPGAGACSSIEDETTKEKRRMR